MMKVSDHDLRRPLMDGYGIYNKDGVTLADSFSAVVEAWMKNNNAHSYEVPHLAYIMQLELGGILAGVVMDTAWGEEKFDEIE